MVDVLSKPSFSAEANRWVIGQAEVTLWSIDSPAIDVEAALENLSREERSRADRYRFPADRRRYIGSHECLRRQLAARLGCAPSQVEFNASAQGKPRLGGRWADAPWRFSLSRSSGMAAIAISETGEVGVDLEAIRPISNLEELAERCLSDPELAEYRAEAPDRALVSFFQLWTCKEAVLKAAGVGLSIDPRSIDIGFAEDPDREPIDLEDIRWRIHRAGPLDGYRAAFAVEGE